MESVTRIVVLVLCAVIAVSCRARTDDEEHALLPLVAATGGCHNEHVDGVCRFTGLNRVGGQQDFPVLPDAPPDPDGTVTFRAEYDMVPSRSRVSPGVRIRAALADRPALERYFSAHARARCAGEIVNPPCPPGVHVVVQLPPPPVGTVLR